MMADFKLGILGSELDLPRAIAEEIAVDADDLVDKLKCADGSYKIAIRDEAPRSWSLEFLKITAAEVGTLDTIKGYGQILNYINGYDPSIPAGGVSVVVLNYSGGRVITNRSGLVTPRFNASMMLLEMPSS